MSILLQMALPYEVGLYHKFDMGGPAQKPIGCPGMNLTVDEFPGHRGRYYNYVDGNNIYLKNIDLHKLKR